MGWGNPWRAPRLLKPHDKILNLIDPFQFYQLLPEQRE